VHLILRDNGQQAVLRYVCSGSDHEAAAAQAVEAFVNGNVGRVVEVETYDGEPQRWDPRFTVEPRHFTLERK